MSRSFLVLFSRSFICRLTAALPGFLFVCSGFYNLLTCLPSYLSNVLDLVRSSHPVSPPPTRSDHIRIVLTRACLYGRGACASRYTPRPSSRPFLPMGTPSALPSLAVPCRALPFLCRCLEKTLPIGPNSAVSKSKDLLKTRSTLAHHLQNTCIVLLSSVMRPGVQLSVVFSCCNASTP